MGFAVPKPFEEIVAQGSPDQGKLPWFPTPPARLANLNLRLNEPTDALSLQYQVHLMDFGDRPVVSEGNNAATVPATIQRARFELTGPLAGSYDIKCRGRQITGDTLVMKNGEWCGDLTSYLIALAVWIEPHPGIKRCETQSRALPDKTAAPK
jgi:hypothetical protein